MYKPKRFEVITHMKHRIFMENTIDGEWVYCYAKHKDGTDTYFKSLEEVFDDIERLEGKKDGKN